MFNAGQTDVPEKQHIMAADETYSGYMTWQVSIGRCSHVPYADRSGRSLSNHMLHAAASYLPNAVHL